MIGSAGSSEDIPSWLLPGHRPFLDFLTFGYFRVLVPHGRFFVRTDEIEMCRSRCEVSVVILQRFESARQLDRRDEPKCINP